MTAREFAYWLQGLFELSETTQLDARQTDLIRRHLNMVFAHEIDPSAGSPEHQAELSKLHDGQTDLGKKLDKLIERPHPQGAPSRTDALLRC